MQPFSVLVLALPLIGHQSAEVATPTGAQREMTEVRLLPSISIQRPRSASNNQYPHTRQRTLDAAPAEQVEAQASPKPGLHFDVGDDDKN